MEFLLGSADMVDPVPTRTRWRHHVVGDLTLPDPDGRPPWRR
jgi:hypothetical protein